MKKRVKIRWILLVVIIALFLAALNGCEEPQVTDQEEIVKAEGHTLNWNIFYMPRRFYPSITLADEEKQVVINLYEGLTRVSDGQIALGMAEAIVPSEDMMSYEVRLKKAQWSDGVRVTTDDFIYSWERRSNYLDEINMLYYDAYINDVEFIDDETFIIHMYQPNSVLLQQLSTVGFMPVRRDVIDLDKAIPTFISDVTNGPYVLKYYRMFGGITLSKNKHYYDFFDVKIDEINIDLNYQFDRVYENYKKGKIDFVQGVDYSQLDHLMQNEPQLKINGRNGIYAFAINSNREFFRDVRVRRLLTLAIDRTELNPYQNYIHDSVALSVIDYSMLEAYAHEDESDADEPYYLVMKPYVDVDKIEGIRIALGSGKLEALNGMTIVTRDTPNDIHIAKLLAEGWKVFLGIDVTVQAEDRYDYAYALKTGDYDVILNNRYHQDDNIRFSLKQYIGETSLNNTTFESYTYDLNVLNNYRMTNETLYSAYKKAVDELDQSTKLLPIFDLYEPVIISDSIESWSRNYEGLYYFGRASKVIKNEEATLEQ